VISPSFVGPSDRLRGFPSVSNSLHRRVSLQATRTIIGVSSLPVNLPVSLPGFPGEHLLLSCPPPAFLHQHLSFFPRAPAVEKNVTLLPFQRTCCSGLFCLPVPVSALVLSRVAGGRYCVQLCAQHSPVCWSLFQTFCPVFLELHR